MAVSFYFFCCTSPLKGFFLRVFWLRGRGGDMLRGKCSWNFYYTSELLKHLLFYLLDLDKTNFHDEDVAYGSGTRNKEENVITRVKK